ncbi:hypothetical protein CMK19_12790, partial [Candidatus Poribacteria bacterium]|nr:hypothetical protein [Candidatus Poribacteria bacterium]
ISDGGRSRGNRPPSAMIHNWSAGYSDQKLAEPGIATSKPKSSRQWVMAQRTILIFSRIRTEIEENSHGISTRVSD